MTDLHPFPCWAFQALVEHLLKTNLHEILSKSRLHCHARNVHSIMLLEAPGKTIRLFVAEPSHPLAQNYPERFSAGMSVGFHAHHCDLTIVALRGKILNWTVVPGNEFEVTEFAYRSELRGERPGFERRGTVGLRTVDQRHLTFGDSVFMHAAQLHTVAAVPGHWAAWLVFDGRDDANYSPACYSTSELERETLDDLYKPVSEDQLDTLLREATLR